MMLDEAFSNNTCTLNHKHTFFTTSSDDYERISRELKNDYNKYINFLLSSVYDGCGINNDNYCCHRSAVKGPCHLLMDLITIREFFPEYFRFFKNNITNKSLNIYRPCNKMII